MRRRDVLSLMVLGSIVLYSWQQLSPAPVERGEQTVNAEMLSIFSPWHGPIGRAQATGSDQGQVLGASTDGSDVSYDRPQSLLPVESYTGTPFIDTLEAMLEQLGVTVYPEDIVEAFPDPSLGIGSTIRVYRATPVEVVDWGKPKTYRTWQQTVEDFLTEQAIELGDNDRVSPGPREQLPIINNRAKLTITRVAVTELTVKEKIASKVIEKEDPELLRGQVKTTPGSDGERTKIYRITRENGVEVKRELLSNKITTEPVDTVKVIGTKVLIRESHTGKATWYCMDPSTYGQELSIKWNKCTNPKTKVASDFYKKGTMLRITNLDSGKQIFVTNDGCGSCVGEIVLIDLHPTYYAQLGGTMRGEALKRIKVDEVLN